MYYEKLYPSQKEIVDSQKYKTSALFMDMGTGKTITSLALWEKHKTPKLLIICLKAKLYDWQKELHHKRVIVWDGKHPKQKLDQVVRGDYDAIVINFESTWRQDWLLGVINNDFTIIVDESHKIKNVSVTEFRGKIKLSLSKQGQFIMDLGQLTKYKIILTATPQSNGYIDYYTQLKFVNIIDSTMTLDDFQQLFVVIGYDYINTPRGMKKVPKINSYTKRVGKLDMLLNKYCVYFKRSKVPYEQRTIRLTFEPPRAYLETLEEFKVTKRIDGVKKSSPYHSFRQMASRNQHKMDYLNAIIESSDENIVVFYTYHDELYYLREQLESVKNINVDEYNGLKKDLTNLKKGKRSIVLANYASASTGLNELVDSDNKVTVYVAWSPTPSYLDFVQSKGRIDRIGQTNDILYYEMETMQSPDTAIYKTLGSKKDFDDNMIKKWMEEI